MRPLKPNLSQSEREPTRPSPAAALAQKISTANQAAQIVAIIVGGLWAAFIFWETVWPERLVGLQPSIQSKVEWSSLLEACRADVSLSIENLSNRRKSTVASVTYTVTPIQPRGLPPGKEFAYLEPKREIPSESTRSLETLEGSYAPKERRNWSVILLLPPDVRRVYELTFILKGGGGEAPFVITALLEPCSKPLPK